MHDTNLCKTFLGTAVLGYPIPMLVNWPDRTDDLVSRSWSSGQFEKIYASLRYLESLGGENDEDLVLIADSFDTWFQLPPQILINRYHTINDRARERIKARTGKDTNQTIVLATEKICWPGELGHIRCYAVPESPLPKYVYGPQTDVPTPENEDNPVSRMRQRYLNSGFTLGPVKDVRTYLRRAQEKALKMDQNDGGADQGVISEIFGEQEYMREISRLHRGRQWKRDGEHDSFEPVVGTNYEFGMGLDYEMSLELPVAFADRDYDWIQFSDRTSLQQAIDKYDIVNPGADDLQSDILDSEPPLQNLNILAGASRFNSNQGRNQTWKDMPLYTNLWTGITPVATHYNGPAKRFRDIHWDQLWYLPYARELLSARAARSSERIAIDKNGKKWYGSIGSSEIQERGFGAATFSPGRHRGWVTWSDLCSPNMQEEVFKDERGPWKQRAVD